MLTKHLRPTLAALALAAALAPAAAQAAFCPLGILLPGSSGCEGQKTCPAGQKAEADNPMHNLQRALEARQDRQMERIRQAVDKGVLTARDTQRLMREQCQFERMQRQALADGFISPWEWAALDEAMQAVEQELGRRDPESPQG